MIRDRYVEAGGRRMRYIEGGAGWPVVLLHAFPLTADMWQAQLEAVPDGWRFIAPDLRGFGGYKPDSPANTTMDDLASDVFALLDTLEIDRAVIGGLSMGGYVTFALLRQAPERFNAAVLADTRAPADTPEGRQARRAMIELLHAKGPGAVIDQLLPKLLGETTRRTAPEIEARVRELFEQNDPAGIEGGITAIMTRPDSTPDLDAISIPTLIVVGEEDTLTPASESEALQTAIQRSQLVVIPGAGHLSNLENPDAFSLALADFLRSNL